MDNFDKTAELAARLRADTSSISNVNMGGKMPKINGLNWCGIVQSIRPVGKGNSFIIVALLGNFHGANGGAVRTDKYEIVSDSECRVYPYVPGADKTQRNAELEVAKEKLRPLVVQDASGPRNFQLSIHSNKTISIFLSADRINPACVGYTVRFVDITVKLQPNVKKPTKADEPDDQLMNRFVGGADVSRLPPKTNLTFQCTAMTIVEAVPNPLPTWYRLCFGIGCQPHETDIRAYIAKDDMSSPIVMPLIFEDTPAYYRMLTERMDDKIPPRIPSALYALFPTPGPDLKEEKIYSCVSTKDGDTPENWSMRLQAMVKGYCFDAGETYSKKQPVFLGVDIYKDNITSGLGLRSPRDNPIWKEYYRVFMKSRPAMIIGVPNATKTKTFYDLNKQDIEAGTFVQLLNTIAASFDVAAIMASAGFKISAGVAAALCVPNIDAGAIERLNATERKAFGDQPLNMVAISNMPPWIYVPKDDPGVVKMIEEQYAKFGYGAYALLSTQTSSVSMYHKDVAAESDDAPLPTPKELYQRLLPHQLRAGAAIMCQREWMMNERQFVYKEAYGDGKFETVTIPKSDMPRFPNFERGKTVTAVYLIRPDLWVGAEFHRDCLDTATALGMAKLPPGSMQDIEVFLHGQRTADDDEDAELLAAAENIEKKPKEDDVVEPVKDDSKKRKADDDGDSDPKKPKVADDCDDCL